MAKNLNLVLLLDCYGELLTERQRDLAEMYYYEDLSLSEIAEMREITRQAVRDSLLHSEQTLLKMEESLGMAKRVRCMRECLDDILNCCEHTDPGPEQIQEISRLASEAKALL